MKTFTDRTPMPFGKFRGKAMAKVPAIYLLWLQGKGCKHVGVKQYILDNLTELNAEAARILQR